ncbi:Cacna1h [Symbiodinium sp. CCMP2592]|nr:Cacna1h [Symbiodinium sp. CCMP2592]
MEVKILQADGLPQDGLIAFKVGSERKQNKMEVGHPCTVMMPTSGPTTCSVSVLKSMGGGELPVPKTAEEGGGKMKVPVVKPDGTTSELLVQTRPLPTKSAEMDDAAKKMQEQARETVQALLSELLRDQPADPYAFMLQRLKASKDNGGLKPSEGVA